MSFIINNYKPTCLVVTFNKYKPNYGTIIVMNQTVIIYTHNLTIAINNVNKYILTV